MPVREQLKLNSKCLIRDIKQKNWYKFLFHFSGILRAIKELTLWNK